MNSIEDQGSMDLRICSSPETAAQKLVDDVISLTHEKIRINGRCVWALSGGSSVLKFYDALKVADKIDDYFWAHLTVCWVDERHVPPEHSESNYGNAYSYFWKEIEGPQLIPVPWNEDIRISGSQYDQKLITHGIESGNDIDLILLGMGTDGHTASLFPKSVLELVTSSKNIGIQKMKEGLLNRITMTLKMINESERKKVFAFGTEKGRTLDTAFNSKRKKEYPILGVNFKNTTFYVDKQFNEALKGAK